jgi:hypothetical protein
VVWEGSGRKAAPYPDLLRHCFAFFFALFVDIPENLVFSKRFVERGAGVSPA